MFLISEFEMKEEKNIIVFDECIKCGMQITTQLDFCSNVDV